MAFLKAAQSAPVVEQCQSLDELLIALRSDDAQVRHAAVRQLGTHPQAFEELARALLHERESAVVSAMFAALAEMRDPSYVHILPQFLASDEAFVRNHAVEAWQSLGTNDAFMAAALLTHPDRDVRILAITVLRVVPGKLIEPYLLTLLEMEGDPSVCAAAVDLLAELGSDEGIEVLRELAKRFNDEDSLRFAIDMAIVQMGESNDFADVV